MTPDDDLRIVRRAYAKQIVHAARATDPRLEVALATLRREQFLPPGPWQLMRFPGGYQETPNDDPVYLYQDAPVALVPAKRLNNGQPSFLTFLISLGRLQEGEHAVHIGTGTGYYTAVISHLAGASGRVTGIEREPDLAARAADNLRNHANVRLIAGDGATKVLDFADVIYANAGASRPTDTWLDAMKLGGRMILPLTVSFMTEDGHLATRGAIFLIERQPDHYAARCMSTTWIYPCEGARDEESERALEAAFKKGDMAKVTRLHRTDDIPEERCWLRGRGWCLTYD
jgi:protein-L-isoaspartate(D-aspartate) O-methyltransferase